MDIFIEHILTRKKGHKEIMAIVGILVGLSVLLFFSFFFMFSPIGSIVFFFGAGLVYLAYYGITLLDVEYEYTVTSGEMDVDKIIHRRKRKRVISVHARTFELVAPVGDPLHKSQENGTFTRVIDVASAPNSDGAYYAIFSKDGQRIKMIFEPNDRMIEAFYAVAPRNVHMKDERY